jgi:threonyl-tRNA synthetase
VGTDEQWAKAESSLRDALSAKGMEFKVNEGEGAFYGPKIDFHIRDCIGRTWQCATIQVDMGQPERFDLSYIGDDNQKHRPVVVHRVAYGSIERFMGILIEQYAGKFPLWLSPVQARVLLVSDKFAAYGSELCSRLKEEGFRADLDSRPESVNYKVREAQLQNIPLMLTVGQKEADAGTVAVRTLDGKVKFGINAGALIEKMHEAIASKAHNIALD